MDFYKGIVASFLSYPANDYERQAPEALRVAKKKSVSVNAFLIFRELKALGCVAVWNSRSSFVTLNTSDKVKVKISHLQGLGRGFKEIISSKSRYKDALSSSAISVSRGRCFDQHDKFEAYKYFVGEDVPLVIKPDIGSKARGVTVGAVGLEQFDAAWNAALEISKNDKVVIEEQFVDGFEARFLVVGGVCEGVYRKIPPFVVGDGEHSVEELIEIKNLVKLNNPHQQSRTIAMNDHRRYILEMQGYSVADVPKSGEIVVLDKGSNASSGADTVEFFEDIHPSYKAVAESAVRCANNLSVCGVDIMAYDFSVPAAPDNYVVLEANSGPGLGGHMFPSLGASRNVAEKIASYALSSNRVVGVRGKELSVGGTYKVVPLGFFERDEAEFLESFSRLILTEGDEVVMVEVQDGFGVVRGGLNKVFAIANEAMKLCNDKCFDYIVMAV